MTGCQYLDALQDLPLVLPLLRTGVYPYVPGLPLCEAARRAAQRADWPALLPWLRGMAEGLRHVYAADGRQFADALVCAARDGTDAAARAAAGSALRAAERGLYAVIGEAYAAAREVQPDGAVTAALLCFEQRMR